jgi:alpha-beta hydrolase superfamily lysophospholipase
MASILFIHGAGRGAWCWRDHFTGWFEARGYTVSAPDLPHHGDLDRRGVISTPLQVYVDAVGRAAADLEPPLVIVAHSLRGFVVEKYLEQAEADQMVPPRKDIVVTTRMCHGAEQIVPGGHNMMLDTAWKQVAIAIETVIIEGLSNDAADRADDLAAIPRA